MATGLVAEQFAVLAESDPIVDWWAAPIDGYPGSARRVADDAARHASRE